MEEWPSGLRRTPGKRVGVHAPRGFDLPWQKTFRWWRALSFLKKPTKENGLTGLCSITDRMK